MIGSRNRHRKAVSSGRWRLTAVATSLALAMSGAVRMPAEAADETWRAADASGVARSAHTATPLDDGRVLVAGGHSAYNFSYNTCCEIDAMATAELYNPAAPAGANSSSTSPLNLARTQHTAVKLPNGKVLVAGGLGDSSNDVAPYQVDVRRQIEIYDPATAIWALKISADCLPRAMHTATVLDETHVLLAGGVDAAGVPTNTAEVYDVAKDACVPTTSMTKIRAEHTATFLSGTPEQCGANCGKVLVAGGVGVIGDGAAHRSAELFTFAAGAGAWTATTPMNEINGRQSHTATLLESGGVFVAGGFNRSPREPVRVTNSTETFNPATGVWTTRCEMTTPRYLHTATKLNNGKVILAGGNENVTQDTSTESKIDDPNSSPDLALASAEVYDPWANPPTCSATASMGEARLNHTSTLITDTNGNDAVLAFGGASSHWSFFPPYATETKSQVVASAEVLSGPVAALDPSRMGSGYWLFATDGGVFSFGGAPFHGSTGGIHLNQPIVGAEPTPSGQGYWLVAADGGIFTFGDAAFLGSTGGIKLTKPIVAMVATPTGNGYWLFASDGGVFAFGDAAFYGSTGDRDLNKPIVGADATRGGLGYYLVALDGGIFTFGDAEFFGSAGNIELTEPVLGMAALDTGNGYYLVAKDGGIFSYGRTPDDARFFGSTGDITLNQPIVGMDLAANEEGYYLVAADGGIFTFGRAIFFGSTGAIKLNRPIVGMATRQARDE